MIITEDLNHFSFLYINYQILKYKINISRTLNLNRVLYMKENLQKNLRIF